MLMRSDRLLTKIEYALRGKHPDPEASLDERAQWVSDRITELRKKAGELDDIDRRLLGLPAEQAQPAEVL